MAIAFVQDANGASANLTTSTQTAVLSSPTTTGNTIIVLVQGDSNGGVLSISDTQSNVYTNLAAATEVINNATDIWYCAGITGGATNTITVTSAATVDKEQIVFAYEFSGISTTTPVDVATVNHGDGITSNTPTATVTTANANDLVIASCGILLGSGTDLPTVGSGYTGFMSNNTGPTSGRCLSGGAEYKIVSAAGSQTATFGLSFSQATWEISLATFKAKTTFFPAPNKFSRQAVRRASER